MKVGFVLPLACALVLKSSLGSAEGPTVEPCRPGFSQNFYTVFIPREQLQGQSVVKVKLISHHMCERQELDTKVSFAMWTELAMTRQAS
ncbi:hypothetical protein Baya_13874 [Bagarius yarrelli]|uniref:Cadherin prodomain domain-containing protein n=1 Tax=Bagarius yarrelli TaxID=175774 RepID=A0A556V889_BAGYA|nr:hypothetical protein Baya_13874 [Bagarius yarrelli]